MKEAGQLNKMAGEIAQWRQGKGFYTPEDITSSRLVAPFTVRDAMLGKLMLAVSELSEAGEAVRDGDLVQFTEEIADVFIRLLDICGTMGIDIEGAITQKMRVNAQRPVRHGRKTCL